MALRREQGFALLDSGLDAFLTPPESLSSDSDDDHLFLTPPSSPQKSDSDSDDDDLFELPLADVPTSSSSTLPGSSA